MAKHLAKLICLCVGGAAGWSVLVNLAELFEGWIPPAAAAGTMLVVTLLLYFPLARPIADLISDRWSAMTHRGRHIRAGSGLSDIPASHLPPAPPCNMCGAPDGPICADCEQEIQRASRA